MLAAVASLLVLNASFTVVEVLPDGGVVLRLSNHVPSGVPSPVP